MFEDARIGDGVYSLQNGWGIIMRIDEGAYPIVVQFEEDRTSFTIEGKLYPEDKYPILFWDEIKFNIPKKPLPDLKVDTEVIVWDIKDFMYKRYFKEFNNDGKIVCFSDGSTSWSSDGNTETWRHWELYND